MYEPHSLLSAIDGNKVPILVMFTLAMLMQTIAMVAAVVTTRRDGWISIPLPCTFLWFAHDLGVVDRYNTWFTVYNHWFLKLFWLGLLSALILELVFFAQAIKVGRAEYLPNGTQIQWMALVVGGAAAFVIVWEYLKTIFDDPLNQAVPAITLFVLPLATTALLLRRRSAAGQSPVIYGSFAAMVVFWWVATVGYYGNGFDSWQYILTGVVAFAMLAGVAVVVARMRSSVSQEVPERAPQSLSSL